MRQTSKQKILEAALELFAYDGYHTTSISKVARKANVSKGLIYNYFESKEELLKSMLDRLLQQVDVFLTTATNFPRRNNSVCSSRPVSRC
jgi:AcrR family transcriptional regulator